MPLIDLKTDLKSLRFGKDRKGGGDSGQPYLTSTIPLPDVVDSKDFLLRGGLNAVTDSYEDVIRLGKYFTDLRTPSGLLFTAKQNLLSRTAVRTQTSGNLNEFVYTPLSTIAQAGVNAFGGHLNKQGLNPFAQTGAYSNNPNLYEVKMRRYRFEAQESPDGILKNRLFALYESKVQNNSIGAFDKVNNISPLEDEIISYGGGPGSDLGIGKTTIRFAKDQRTGINNPNVAYGNRISFIAPSLNSEGITSYDFSVFKRRTKGISTGYGDGKANYFNIIFSSGASREYIKQEGKSVSEIVDVINSEGDLLRGPENITGIRNPLLAGSPEQTQKFISPSLNSEGITSYDFSVFRRPTEDINYFNVIYSSGVSRRVLEEEGALIPEFEYDINPEGQFLRGGDKGTGERNSLVDTRPGYFYGTPGETGKAPYEPGDYLQSLSLLTTGDRNTLNREWNSVSKEFLTWTDETLENYINEEGKQTNNPSVTLDGDFTDTNTAVTTRNGSATLTQEQILNQALSRSNGSPIQDFRKKITSATIGTEAYNAARKNGTLTSAPSYTDPNIRIEGRVGLGDPGSSNLNRRNYTQGALLPDGKVNVVDKVNALYMYNAENVTSSKVKNDFVKFRFAVINPDLPNEKTFIHFRAIFDGSINDNMSAQWDSFKYLGRGEEFFNYTGFTREVSFDFQVVAQSKPELSLMYQKLNYLQSSLTPNFNSTDGYMRGNLHQLTIGGYFYEQPGIITTLNYTMPDDSTWEIGIPTDFNQATTIQAPDGSGIKTDPSVKELSHRIQVSVTFKPIHRFLPQIIGSPFDTDNPNGIFGTSAIRQRYIALANETSGNLYSAGTKNKTEGPDYTNKLGFSQETEE